MMSSKCKIKFKWEAHVVTQKTSKKKKKIAFLALIKFCEIFMRKNLTTYFQGNLWRLYSSRTGNFFFLCQNMTNIGLHNLSSFCINSVYSCQNFFISRVLQSNNEWSHRHCEMNGKTLTSLLWHRTLLSPLKNAISPMYNCLHFA